MNINRFISRDFDISTLWVMLFAVIVVVFTIGHNLLPREGMFVFHDKTQFSRVLEYAYELRNLQIPPIYAQHYNFGIGYPIFLFYAPMAYVITSIIHIVGVDITNTLRISFLLALNIGGIGMFMWLHVRYKTPAALAAAALYVASPWFASEIFVRGNLATVWFLALAPWSLWGLTKQKKWTGIKTLLIAASFLTHNVLSVVWLGILLFYSIVGYRKHRVSRLGRILVAALITSFFWVPALSQIGGVYASEIATKTRYADHFLCLFQVWSTPSWGFGGSAPGCIHDGMSFMLGKAQIVFAIIGLFVGVRFLPKRRRVLADALIVLCTLFLTLPDSAFIWKLIPPLQITQFPWRVLSLTLIFLTGLSAAAFQVFHDSILFILKGDRIGMNKVYKKMSEKTLIPAIRSFQLIGYTLHVPPIHYFVTRAICIIAAIGFLMYSSKFFYGLERSAKEVYKVALSPEYIRNKAAYEIPEYVPKTVDYKYWLSFRSQEPSKKDIQKLDQQFSSYKPSVAMSIVGGILSLIGLILVICLLR